MVDAKRQREYAHYIELTSLSTETHAKSMPLLQLLDPQKVSLKQLPSSVASARESED